MKTRLLSFRIRILAMLMIMAGGLWSYQGNAQTVVPFTSSGTFTVPAGVTSIKVEVWGGGGGGGGVNGVPGAASARAGGGGSGGTYTLAPSVAVTPGAIITVTVGAGGTAVSAANGGTGGTSTFGSATPVTAAGGGGGIAGTQAVVNGAGGGVSTGITNSGGAGAAAAGGNGGGGGGGAGNAVGVSGNGVNGSGSGGGAGGAGGTPGGVGGGGATTSGPGTAATLLSGGGGGARDNAHSTNQSGGVGFRGQVVVTYTPPTLTATALTSFGSVCTNTVAGPNSFTITGTALTTANVTVGALSGFTYSTTSGGTYTSTLSLTSAGGAFSQQVFVQFSPTAVQSYNGNIAVGGGGASSINVAATGSGVNTAPTTTTGAATGITTSSATVPGTISATGCTAVTAYGVEYSTTNNFANGTGTQAPGSNLVGSSFSVTLSSLTPATIYYYHAYATNGGGTGYSAQGTFTTAQPACAPPANQGTTINFGISTTTTIPGTFTAASGGASNYLVLASTGTVPTQPVNGTTYSAANISSLGSGLIFGQNVATAVFTQSGLSSNTAYTIYIFSYNNVSCTGGPVYSVATPLTGNAYTCIAPPTGLAAGSLTATTASLSWTAPSGNVTSYDVLYKLHSAGTYTTVTNVTSPYVLTGLTNNTQYDFEVTSNNTVNTSCGSATATAVTFTTAFTSAATDAFRSAATGNWSATGTWLSSHDGTTFFASSLVPTNQAASVTIMNSHVVTVDGAFTSGALTIAGTSTNTTLTISGTNSLAITGNFTINQPTTNNITNLFAIGSGGVTVSGSVAVGSNNSTSLRIAKITMGTGTFAIAGNLALNAGFGGSGNSDAVLDMSGGAGTLSLAGNFTAPNFAGTFTPGTGLVIYNGSGAQSMLPAFPVFSFNDVTIAKSAGTVSLTVGTTIGGDLTIAQGTFSAAGFSFSVGGDWSNSGTYAPTTNTITFNGATQVITGSAVTAFSSLVINSTVSTTLLVNASVSANLTINSGRIFDLSTFTCNRATSGGTITIAGTLRTASTYPANFTTNTMTGGTVEYYGGTQTVAAVAYNNLTITSAGTKTLAGNVTAMTGALLINSGATLDLSTFTLNRTASGSTLTDAGTLRLGGTTGGQTGSNFPLRFGSNTLTGGTVEYYGTTQTIFNTVTYNNLVISTAGVKSVSGTTPAITGNLTVNPGATLNIGANALNKSTTPAGTFTLGSGSTFRLSGTTGGINGSNFPTNLVGTFDPTSTVEYYGTSPQIVASVLSGYGNLTVNNAAGVSLPNDQTINGALNFLAGKLDVSTTTLTLSSLTPVISGASASSYIITDNSHFQGTLAVSNVPAGTFQFPIGTSSIYLPASVNPATATSWTANVFDTATVDGSYGGTPFTGTALNAIVNAIWTITPSGGATASATPLTLNWDLSLEGSQFKLYADHEIGISHYNGTAFDPAIQTSASYSGKTVTANFTTFSPFGIGFINDPLPVVLVDFNAVLNSDKTVGLSWTTQQEVNSSHFDVLRSTDGSTWVSIGTVQAQGNASFVSNYTFTDKSPASGINYYRLKMVDIDGKFGYSNIRIIRTTSFSGISVFPNPARDYVNVSVGGSSSPKTIRLISQNGQVMQVKSVNSTTGTTISLNVHNYVQGTYYLQIIGTDGTNQTTKVVIAR